MIRNVALFVALTGLSGCFALTSTEAPPSTYTMQYKASGSPAPATDIQGVLTVPEPDMPAGLETERIALNLSGGRQLDYYAGARWPEPLDHIMQDIIIQGGRNNLPQMVIDTPDIDLPANYKLAVKVNEFAPVYAGGPDGLPQLKAAFTFTLIQLPEHIVVTDFTLENSQQAKSNDLTAITSGLESLLQAMLTEAYGQIGAVIK